MLLMGKRSGGIGQVYSESRTNNTTTLRCHEKWSPSKDHSSSQPGQTYSWRRRRGVGPVQRFGSSPVKKLGSDLGPIRPENQAKPEYYMQGKAKRLNKMQFYSQIRSLPLYPSELQARSLECTTCQAGVATRVVTLGAGQFDAEAAEFMPILAERRHPVRHLTDKFAASPTTSLAR